MPRSTGMVLGDSDILDLFAGSALSTRLIPRSCCLRRRCLCSVGAFLAISVLRFAANCRLGKSICRLGKTIISVNSIDTSNLSDVEVAELVVFPVGSIAEISVVPGRYKSGCLPSNTPGSRFRIIRAGLDKGISGQFPGPPPSSTSRTAPGKSRRHHKPAAPATAGVKTSDSGCIEPERIQGPLAGADGAHALQPQPQAAAPEVLRFISGPLVRMPQR